MIKDHKFVDAYFTDNERTVVESVWKDEDENIRTLSIKAEEGNTNWGKLLKYIDIDLLHERTFKRIRALDDQLKTSVISIAKERGLIYDVDNINTDMYKAIAAVIFKDFNEEEDKEALFLYKLALFENDKIKNASNKELKTKLRKSKSLIEATKVAIDLVESN